MPPVVEKLPIPALALGEGPHWSPAAESLYLVDIMGKRIYRYHPGSSAVHSVLLDVPTVGFVTPVEGAADQLLAGTGVSLRLVQWDGRSEQPTSLTVLQELDGEPGALNRINDGKVDPAGRAWFGTMRLENPFEERGGSFYSYSKDSGLKKHFSEVGISNGLTWSGNTMYYIDSKNAAVEALDYDSATGNIGNRRVVFDLKKNNLECFPDGMTIDTEGKLWVACYLGARVIRVDPESGRLLEEVQIPTKNVTSVAWGGPDLRELFVTTARDGEDPASGLTYRVTGLPYRGLPMHNFRL